MKVLFFSLVALVFVTVVQPVSAAETCLTINGGGKTDQKVCITPAPNTQPPATKPLPQRTTGGQTVYPANTNKSTPNTGPTETSYAILAAMAAGGVYLLRKTRVTS